ncbi:MAG: hypothetical protein ACRDVE_00415, partial [Actinocrinis sp.]
LGLWINLGGWGDPPPRHVAIEPAFGAHDDPSDAYAQVKPLPAGESTAWQVVIEAGVGADAGTRSLPPDNDYELFMHKS